MFFHIFVLFQVLQKFWNRWKSRLEEKEEEQQQALTSVAHARYRYAEKYYYKFVPMGDLWAFGSHLKSGNTLGSVTILMPIAVTLSMKSGQFTSSVSA